MPRPRRHVQKTPRDRAVRDRDYTTLFLCPFYCRSCIKKVCRPVGWDGKSPSLSVV